MSPLSPKNTTNRLLDLLGPQGRLAGSWADYEYRSSQIEMAEKINRAFEQDDIILVEAGTGTGKTLAYLLPALLNGRKTVVSTGTKNLQEQIFDKDIPFIRRHLGRGFKAACLKGRENYLCLYRYKAFVREPSFILAGEAVFLDALVRWAEETATGDRAELADLPDDFMTWSDLSASSDRCLGTKCPDFKDCFLQKARRTAAAADLVVVNHHLFLADLAIRNKGQSEVIPHYEAVIFDEAHLLEEVATQYFGLSVSSWRLAELSRDIGRALMQAKKMNKSLNKALVLLKHQADSLARNFFVREGEFELWAENDPTMDRLRQFGAEVVAGLDNIAGRLEAMSGPDEEIESLALRARTISSELSFIIDGTDSGYVYWAEHRSNGVFLRASPIEVSSFFQEKLYARSLPLVFTSATLAAEKSFDYFRERLGIWPEAEGFILDSPFDFKQQSLFYVPRNMPAPTEKRFLNSLTAEVEQLLNISRGRAFVLFTSYRNLNYVAERLPARVNWPCLVQGQAPRSVLLDRFREQKDSVLLATQSFWQGVDVPGESLSAVIIDKLPFSSPERPLVKARVEKLRQEGLDPFMHYQVPEAIINLKQGLGRLIRTKTDHGLLALLDMRIVTRRYGKKFLDSLPPSPLTHDQNQIRDFFQLNQ